VLTTVAGIFIFKKQRLIRYLSWGISFMLAAYLFLLTPLNWYHDKELSKDLLGTYIINVDSSKYSNIDLNKFKSLTMTVNSDNTFKFNKNTPFFSTNNGKWSFWIDGDAEITKCSFNNCIVDFEISTDHSSWIFKNSSLVNGKIGDKITFKHK
jgi:hypothetical protein